MVSHSSTSVLLRVALLLLFANGGMAQSAGSRDIYSFDDRPTDYRGGHPEWFKESFLDLGEDLEAALESGKSGLIIYFGQAGCAYCKEIMNENLSRPDLVEYVVRNFDVIGLNIHDLQEVTAPDGETLTVKDYSIREGAYFTPSLIFFGKDRRKALTLRGFYPPYEMRAALEYVADGHYQAQSFGDYLDQAKPPPLFDDEELNPDALFTAPPFALDRSRMPAGQPLVVIFEQPECHACDVLHSEPMQDPVVRERLTSFDLVQLNLWDQQTPVLTPDGRGLTPREWAADLGLFYTPTLVFFDAAGKEIMRIDSVVQFFRLAGVLRYVSEKAYLEYPLFQQWKYAHAKEEREAFASKPRLRAP